MNSNHALLVLAATSFFALSSFAATDPTSSGGVGVGIALAGANSNSSSGATSGSKSSSRNTTTYTSTSTYREVRQVPTAYAPDALPTAPCFKPITGGGSSPFFGVSFGTGKIDKGCDDRETARIFAQGMHNYTAAAKILCSTDAAKRAHLTMEDCMDNEETVAAPAPPPVVVNVPAPAPPAVAPIPASSPTSEAAPTPLVPPAETKKISQ
jgi:hypothetical protein